MRCVTLWGGKTVHILKDPEKIDGLCATMCGLPKIYGGRTYRSPGGGVTITSTGHSNRLVLSDSVVPTCGFCRSLFWKKSRIAQA